MSSYYQYLFENDDEKITLNNYKSKQFDALSTQKQIDYLKCFVKDYNIIGSVRESDNKNNKFYIEIQDENMTEFAIKQFAAVTGLTPHGDTFVVNERSFIFSYSYNARKPMRADGTSQWEDKEPLSHAANAIRRAYGFGQRMSSKMFKPNLHLNPRF